jgi:4-diphosphocytidyl-2-C-methyl-D-erythritol kinase
LYDEITIGRSAHISLTCTDPAVPANEKNLSWKAAELFLNANGITEGVSIHIRKRIPTGAGLGGGSSNAGATLLALQRLFGVTMDHDRLELLALQIGSDVPYFLRSGTAHGEGRGERLTYFPFRLPYHIVVVNPGIHVRTPWAYGAVSAQRQGIFPRRPALRETFASLDDITMLQNDFEKTVFGRYPVIAMLKTTMLEHRAVLALMCGSGSSVFGLFEKETDAQSVTGLLSGNYFTHHTGPDFIPELE